MRGITPAEPYGRPAPVDSTGVDRRRLGRAGLACSNGQCRERSRDSLDHGQFSRRRAGGNLFSLSRDPTLAGWALFRAAISAKAPPLLAPGAMIQLGLLGLVYSYVNSPRNRGKGKGESL